MEFQAGLSQTPDKTPACLDRRSKRFERPRIHQALAATGKASIRRQRLRAEHMVWLVMGKPALPSCRLDAPVLSRACQTQGFQLPKENASQFLTDWHWALRAFYL
ncbi:MAG: hypothetical protein V4646_10250 [Pseudomonadota bacterium]